MVKCTRIDRVSSSATIRFDLAELRLVAQSVDRMADKYEVNLLSLVPDKDEKQKLTQYIALKRNLNRILGSLM